MGKLKDESKLFRELCDYFDKHNGNITLEVFKNAIKIAKKYDKEEIQFVLFKLKYNNSEIETGIDKLDIYFNVGKNLLNTLTEKPYKLAFIYSVLEAA